MISMKQRDALQAAIWKIANEVRGAVDGWDFKQFVLGTLFYRFISENFTNHMEGGDESIHYATFADDKITPETKHVLCRLIFCAILINRFDLFKDRILGFTIFNIRFAH